MALGNSNLGFSASGGGGGGTPTTSPITIENTNSLFSTGLIGTGAGSIAEESNFFGEGAGFEATNASNSNFIGTNAGNQATNAFDSNFLGFGAGYQATYANGSNFFGREAGYGVTGVDGQDFYSNFFGSDAGRDAINANNSNFFGSDAGLSATNANNSNFFGQSSGLEATNANSSNFIGSFAGYLATTAYNSNFIGYQAGESATNAYYSNFFGQNTGRTATNANNSNFLGTGAGQNATNAANSIFIGLSAGISDTVDNTANGLSSILIGSYTNTGGFSNSILLGSGTSASQIANTKVNQFMLADTITDVRWSGIEYTLPAAQATNAGDVLSNDGAGVLSWATVGNLRGLFAQTADSTPVANTAVETTIIGAGVGGLTVPANGFNIGDSFICLLDGLLSCSSSATLHIRVKTGTGVLLADTGIINMSAATNKPWIMNLYFTIRTLGGAGTASVSSGGLFSYIRNGGVQFEGYVLSNLNTTTFNTTISNTLVITAEWDPASTGNSIFTRNFTLTKSY